LQQPRVLCAFPDCCQDGGALKQQHQDCTCTVTQWSGYCIICSEVKHACVATAPHVIEATTIMMPSAVSDTSACNLRGEYGLVASWAQCRDMRRNDFQRRTAV
jgi:hypothetical protein